MNPFEKLLVQTTEQEMTRSMSFGKSCFSIVNYILKDLSNSEPLTSQSRSSISSLSNAIAHDPAQLAKFLGYSTAQNKPIKKLDTIHEHVPTTHLNVRI